MANVSIWLRRMVFLSLAICVSLLGGCASTPTEAHVPRPALPGGEIVIQVASAQAADAFAAGRAAAESLRDRMGATSPHAIIVAECFEEASLKRRVLDGVASVFPRENVFGCATYGSFSGAGCLDVDAVSLMGIGGDGIAVAAALEEHLGVADLTMDDHSDLIEQRLRTAGQALVRRLPRTPEDRLLVVMADAHSPKNQFLVAGVQAEVGSQFPITGGSANKNAGQTFIYYAGRMYEDAAVALVLSGDFEVALSGRQAKSNAAVITSAGEATAEAREKLQTKPFAAIAFNCAGRKGKLDRLEDELEAIQEATGGEVPLFGCYCAGEIGPADTGQKDPAVLSSGVGWHVMLTMLGRD